MNIVEVVVRGCCCCVGHNGGYKAFRRHTRGDTCGFAPMSTACLVVVVQVSASGRSS